MITGMDLSTRFTFSYTYKSLSSLQGKDFMEKFRYVAPFSVKHIQTDNGGEFEKYFEQHIKNNNLIHFYNYPRHPKSNAYIERFNRTVQEQFRAHTRKRGSWHLPELEDDLNTTQILWICVPDNKLMEYRAHTLIKCGSWYNTCKPHKALNKLPPLKYYLNSSNLSQKKSNMLWTTTKH